MAKAVSITVYPSPVSGEYLTVSDAMRQILDLIEALERTEAVDSDARRIVWRLTDAHTNSPPFTVKAEAYSIDPTLAIGLEADRVISLYATGIDSLLNGEPPDWIDADLSAPIRRALKRNLNGVGQTKIEIEGRLPVDILPAKAQVGVTALDRIEAAEELTMADWRRTEFGSLEGILCGLTYWNGKPSIVVIERLSEQKVTCVLNATLVSELGPQHKWSEAWSGHRLLISGALHYGADGLIKRVDVDSVEDVPWSDLLISDLKGIDLLEGKTVSEHLGKVWGEGSA